jgi:hypothetical protein
MDGRVITEVTSQDEDRGNILSALGADYKQLNAPFGSFGVDTLTASTKAIASTDEVAYDRLETKIANLTLRRNDVAGAIREALNDDSFGDSPSDMAQARSWMRQAESLIAQAHALATS